MNVLVAQAAWREARLAQLLLGRPDLPAEDLLGSNWGIIVTVCENWDGPATWQRTVVDTEFVRRALAGEMPAGGDIIDLDGHRRVIVFSGERAEPAPLERLALRLHQSILAAGVVVHTTFEWRSAGDEAAAVLRRALDRLGADMMLAASTFVRPNRISNAPAAGLARENRQRLAYIVQQGVPAAVVGEIHAALDQLDRMGASQPAIVQTLADLFGVLREQGDPEAAARLPDVGGIAAAVRRSGGYRELSDWVDSQVRPFSSQPSSAATPRALAGKLAQRLRDSYWEDISIQAFAAEHGVSLAYFSRLFKAEMGVTFSAYQAQVRMDRAKEMLDRLDLRPVEVAGLVGYGDPKYFGQLFRRIVGVSPLDYQRSRSKRRI
ncbi:MAG TPA: AraC family transcriptional regulator [Anaerolineae bacterium]